MSETTSDPPVVTATTPLEERSEGDQIATAELHTVTITPRTVYDVRCSCTGYGWDGVGKEMAETLADGHREWVEKHRAK